jgi:sulfonate dioxygenase
MYIDTATVDYDTSLQARHLFRLSAMTEVPMAVIDSKQNLEKTC